MAAENESQTDLKRRISERFGVFPNFFLLAPETPEITEKLWGLAEAAYLDNPLPSIFKERLFVYLSRFCAARYCVMRHVAFLIGLGYPAGDPQAQPQTVDDVILLLRRPLPRGEDLDVFLSLCAAHPAPLVDIPPPGSQLEEAVIALATHTFLQTAEAAACLESLERTLGAVRLQYVLLLLTFIRAAHYWTKVHKQLDLETDIENLLATNEILAQCLLLEPEGRFEELNQSSTPRNSAAFRASTDKTGS